MTQKKKEKKKKKMFMTFDFPAGIYMFKVSIVNTKTICEIYLKLIKTP